MEEAKIDVVVAGKVAGHERSEGFHLRETSDWTWTEDQEGTERAGYPGGGGSKIAVVSADAELAELIEEYMAKQEAVERTRLDWLGWPGEGLATEEDTAGTGFEQDAAAVLH